MRAFAETAGKNETDFYRSGARQNSPPDADLRPSVSPSNFQIQRRAGCSCGGDCPSCAAKNSNLSISRPHDRFEQEADRIAEQIINKSGEPNPSLRESAGSVQRKAKSSGTNAAPAAGNMPQNGQPLSASARSFFEPRFGEDLSHVRIHADAAAHEAAKSVNAIAYTIGSNIVFERGRYAPDTLDGRRLLAHELTHVLQQTGGTINRKLDVQPVSPMLQRQQATCAIDLVQVAKVLAGDEDAALEVLNCCQSGVGPLPSGCTQDAIRAARKVLKGKGKSTGPKKANCTGFTGFRPANSKEFMGQCCRGEVKTEFGGGTTITGVESKENCCLPERISFADAHPHCCAADEIVEKGLCAKRPEAKVCPPDKTMTLMGTCIDKPKVKPPPADKPPEKPPALFTMVNTIVIEFKRDEPQSWSSFKNSVTTKGQTQFDALVTLLTTQPDAKVQLDAHASSERPERDESYNKRLTDKRVKMVVDELKKKKIDTARVGKPPGEAAPGGCEEVAAGQLSCGDVGSSAKADPADRKVVAKVFTVPK